MSIKKDNYDRLLKYKLTKDLEKRTGLKVNLKFYNVFRYLEKKMKLFNQITHQNHI
jgi:hypothetical protein